MTKKLLIRQVRPWGGPTVDVLVEDGLIQRIEPNIVADDGMVVDGRFHLLLPGLVNAHAHLDKNLMGLPWHRNQLAGHRVQDFVEYERRVQREVNHSPQVQSARQVEASIATGVTHIRTHVDVDAGVGLRNLEGVLSTREQYQDMLTMQIVAFPQGGMLSRPGSVELLEEAIKAGADCVGGLDPAVIDRDPVKHLDTIFGIAARYNVDLDIHLHEPGMLGAFTVELIAERTRALSLQGRVTISHVFCLGTVEQGYLHALIDLLLENRITIMTLGSGHSPFPPIKTLYDAGVSLCTGTDGVRDTWGPYYTIDMLERVKLMGYRSGLRRDEEIEMLLKIATYGGAQVMGAADYGLEVGKRADFVILGGETPAEAVIEQPHRTYVVKNGKILVADGSKLFD
ncbi:MAG: amidohydrolase family protein [Chloroflexi bacterium]|nr:amidohydrolase family protein [Chloroflexota bacterium]